MDEVDLDININLQGILGIVDTVLIFGAIIFRVALESNDIELMAEVDSYWNGD